MRSPHGLPLVESCQTCPLRKSPFACNFSPELRREFDSVSHSAAYPEGAIITIEGQSATGLFILCSGQVKLTNTSKEGRSVILRIAQSGEFVGLGSILSGRPHGANAETLTPALTRFVSKQDFMRLMQKYPELGIEAAHSLSVEYAAACRVVRAMALAPSSASRLASLLVSWCPQQSSKRLNAEEIKFKSAFTHEEIAAMIGTTRETVTRVFGDFRRKGILNVNGATLVVRDLQALESMAV